MRKLTMMAVLVAGMVAAFAAVAYADIITGTNRDDVLMGTAEKDQINGLGGKDDIFGWGATDDIHGGRGNDELRGNARLDDVTGGRGSDTILGGGGYDVIHAYDGFVDHIACGSGKDEVFADFDPDWVVDDIENDCEHVNGKPYPREPQATS